MEEINLVEIWLRKDPTRWIAGALAGVFAGIVMFAFSALFCVLLGVDPLFVMKAAAIPFVGYSAMALHGGVGTLLVGFIFFEVIATLLGVFYAQMTGTNYLPALLGMGVVWGTFGWIFINNLFIQSWKPLHWTQYSYGAALLIWLVFGLSLTSVAFFDQMIRGKKI